MDTQNNNPTKNANNTRPLGLGERPALRAANAAPSPAARANNRNQTISRVKRLVTAASLAGVLLGGGMLAERDVAQQEALLTAQTTSQPLYDPQDISTAATGAAASATVPIVAQAQDTATATTAQEATATATSATNDVVVAQAPATATDVPVAAAPATATDVPVAQAPATATAPATAKAAASSSSSSTSKAPVARTRSSK